MRLAVALVLIALLSPGCAQPSPRFAAAASIHAWKGGATLDLALYDPADVAEAGNLTLLARATQKHALAVTGIDEAVLRWPDGREQVVRGLRQEAVSGLWTVKLPEGDYRNATLAPVLRLKGDALQTPAPVNVTVRQRYWGQAVATEDAQGFALALRLYESKPGARSHAYPAQATALGSRIVGVPRWSLATTLANGTTQTWTSPVPAPQAGSPLLEVRVPATGVTAYALDFALALDDGSLLRASDVDVDLGPPARQA